MSSFLNLIFGAIMGVIATEFVRWYKEKMIKRRNKKSLRELPSKSDCLSSDICTLQEWNSRFVLTAENTEISYNSNKTFDRDNPDISNCRFITDKDAWTSIYQDITKNKAKYRGAVSYVTDISLDHNEFNIGYGKKLEIEVSTCDYLGHEANGNYFRTHQEDWNSITKIISSNKLNDYFSVAMPGKCFY